MLMMEVESERESDESGETQPALLPPSTQDQPISRLRARKPSRIQYEVDLDDSDGDWKPVSGKKSRKRRGRRKTASDEENVMPAKRKREKRQQQSGMEMTCEACGTVFSDLDGLEQHIAASHDVKQEPQDTEDGMERSERCRKYFEQLKTERKFQCELCSKTFITSGHLSTHMYCHSGRKWTCEGCGKDFSCERSLTRHKETFPGEHWFPCPLCEMTFFRAINIVKHLEIKHPDAPVNVGTGVKPSSGCIDDTNGESTGSGDGVFACRVCSKVFYSVEGLNIHKEAMHGSQTTAAAAQVKPGSQDSYVANYKCEVCGKEFVSLEGYEYHKVNQHSDKEAVRRRRNGEKGETTLVCKICGATFTVKGALQTHLKSHNVTKNMEVKSGAHQCCICPRSFTSSDGLKYHLATHTGERRYGCGQCGKRFIKKTHLSEHIATHSQVKYFKCSRCPRTFSTHSAYKKHLKHFPGPHSFPCNKCGKLFTKESMIEKHLCVDLVKITMAPEVKALLSEDMIEEYLCLAEEQAAEDARTRQDEVSLSCYKCFKVFPSLEALQAHQNEHVGKQSYQCRFCTESFKRADAFGAHIRNHLGSTPYMCLQCNRKFISPFTLSMHAKNYPGEHSFTCQKCGRWFPSEKRLDRHDCILQSSDKFTCACNLEFRSWNQLLEHAGTKPYKCCSCEMTYTTLMALAKHLKKHTGVKPFVCEICGKAFRAKNNYLNHKNVHLYQQEMKCPVCDYTTKSQKRLEWHLSRKHEMSSNLSSNSSSLCPMCGMIFPYLSHMKRHLELDHGDEAMLEDEETKKTQPAVLCTLCGKLLNNKYTLASHMKKVHDPNNPAKDRILTCETCGEKFRSAKRLERHREVHEAPGLRACELCGKEVYFAKEMRKHMKKHDTNKPFSCNLCGKHFKVSASLKYHSTICRGNTEKVQRKSTKPPVTKVVSPETFIYGIGPVVPVVPVELGRQQTNYSIQIHTR